MNLISLTIRHPHGSLLVLAKISNFHAKGMKVPTYRLFAQTANSALHDRSFVLLRRTLSRYTGRTSIKMALVFFTRDV